MPPEILKPENRPDPPALPGSQPTTPHAPPPPGIDVPGAEPPQGGPPTGIDLADWQKTPDSVKARLAKVAKLLREQANELDAV